MKNHYDTGHLQEHLKTRSARGGLATLAAQGLKFIVNLTGIFALSRLLAPDDFGLIAMVTSFTGIVVLLKDMGLSAATVQSTAITSSQVTTLFWVNAGVSGLISVALAISAPLFVKFYGRPEVGSIIIASAAGFFVGGLGVQHQALLSRQMEFVRLAAVDFSSILLSTILGIGLARAGAGYWSLVGMQASAAITSTVGLWIASRWVPGKPKLDRSAFAMLNFGARLTVGNLLNYTSRNADNILIGRFWGSESLGFYFRAYQLLMLPLSQISGPISAVAIPALSRLTDLPERYRAAYLQIINRVLLITIPLIVFLMASADLLIDLALGSKWAGAVPLFIWLSVIGVTQPLSNSCGWLFISQGRSRDFMRQALIDCLLSLIAIVGGLPWGAVGVASSYSISGLLLRAPVLFWLTGRKGPVTTTDLYGALFGALPIATAVGVVTWLTKPHLAFMPIPLQMAVLSAFAAGVSLGWMMASAKGRLLVRESIAMLRKSIDKASCD